jgi:hypothetical protein
VLLATPLVAPSPAEATPPAEHCIVEVVGQEADGRYSTTATRCYGTYRAMLASMGVTPRSDSEDARVLGAEAVSLMSVLAVHYDGSSGSGSTLTVNGVACSGGYINLDSWWRNKISSTYSNCGTTRHYDGLDKTGLAEITSYGLTNLSLFMNNRTESVQYS